MSLIQAAEYKVQIQILAVPLIFYCTERHLRTMFQEFDCLGRYVGVGKHEGKSSSIREMFLSFLSFWGSFHASVKLATVPAALRQVVDLFLFMWLLKPRLLGFSLCCHMSTFSVNDDIWMAYLGL